MGCSSFCAPGWEVSDRKTAGKAPEAATYDEPTGSARAADATPLTLAASGSIVTIRHTRLLMPQSTGCSNGGIGMRRGPVSWRLVALVAAALLTTGLTTVLSAGSASAAAANPTVAPITGGAGKPAPSNLNGFDLASVGYEQSEFSLSGTANAY